MKNALYIWMAADNRHYVLVAIAIVDNYGNRKLLGKEHLKLKIAHLLFLIGIGIMIVKADLAKGYAFIGFIKYERSYFRYLGGGI